MKTRGGTLDSRDLKDINSHRHASGFLRGHGMLRNKSFESVKWSIKAVQRIHPKTAHVADSEGEAAEAETGAEWCPKGTRRPGAVTFQCRRRYGLPLENRERKVGRGGRPQNEDGGQDIRWQADELSLTMGDYT